MMSYHNLVAMRLHRPACNIYHYTLFLDVGHGDFSHFCRRLQGAVENADHPNDQSNDWGFVEWNLKVKIEKYDELNCERGEQELKKVKDKKVKKMWKLTFESPPVGKISVWQAWSGLLDKADQVK